MKDLLPVFRADCQDGEALLIIAEEVEGEPLATLCGLNKTAARATVYSRGVSLSADREGYAGRYCVLTGGPVDFGGNGGETGGVEISLE